MHLAPRVPLPYNIGIKEAAWMIIREYGDSAARVILVQPVGQHELPQYGVRSIFGILVAFLT